MNKKEFHNRFKTVVDDLVDELPMPQKLNKFAEYFLKAPETLQKWYNGISAPANASREIVIKHLYAEQKKREVMDIVRHVIKNELKINVKEYRPMYSDNQDLSSFEIMLKLSDEIICSELVSLGV